jgi:hypothetical protein
VRKDLAALVNGSCAGPRTIEKMDVLLVDLDQEAIFSRYDLQDVSALGLPAASWQGGQGRLAALQRGCNSCDADMGQRFAPQPSSRVSDGLQSNGPDSYGLYRITVAGAVVPAKPASGLRYR